MEYKTRTLSGLPSCLILPLAIVALSVFFTGSTVHADGKLRRVKEAVRKHEFKPSPKPEPNRDSRNEQRDNSESRRRDDSNHDDDQHRNDNQSGRNSHRTHRSQQQNHGSGSPSFVFVSQPRPYIEPVVIPVSTGPICPSQHHVIVQQPTPIQSGFDQPVYESVVYDPPPLTAVKPVPQAIGAPMVEPYSIELQEPASEEIVFEGNGIGLDWFSTNTSRFWATIGSDFDGITTVGLGLHLQSLGSLGLDGSVTTLRESTEYYRDHIWIGDVNLVYEVLARGDVRGRVGLGVNWLSDSWGAEAGFNLTAGVDLRLTDRVLISAEGDVGNLGDADFFHGRVNLARRFETCEWMLGVDHYNIGGAEVNSFFTGILYRF